MGDGLEHVEGDPGNRRVADSAAEFAITDFVAAGDPEAFGQMVVEHAPTARRLARLLLRNEADADDAVQEGLLSAWQAIGRYDPARPFRPWLLRIVLNAARDLGRRRKVRDVEPLTDTEAEPRAGPDRETDRSLLRERLGEALLGLSERARIAVTLFDAEGYSHAEIAENPANP